MSGHERVVLAARVRKLEVSPTVAMAQRARLLTSQGIKVYNFAVGEPDQPTPPSIVAAACEAMKAGQTKYTPAAGLPALREAVAQRYRDSWGAPFVPDQVTITVGGKQALALLYMAILDRGSEVVVPTPCWPTFAEAARIAGGRPALLPLSEKNGFRLTARVLKRAIGPRTRAVLVNSPSNPTGAVVDPDELVAIARVARRHGLFLIFDDTYSHLIFREGGAPALDAVAEAAGENLVVTGTMSKAYCMTGWRIGWVIGSRHLAAACAALNSHSVQSTATFSQVAAAQALAGPQDVVRELAAQYRRRRDFMQPKIDALPGVVCPAPEGSFYLFPNVKRHLSKRMPDTVTLGTRLLEEKAVAVVPGEGFGAPGYFRLSCATSLEDLREGARRLADFFSGLVERSPGRR
ncbi:MAG: pyridoxal phosphate-dependent aminotransferase [Acidobacteria bacterium]|jgi:aspartate aminotransferase|nr:pyridoxal phosphate-dependent aminotransferase [Acidobacteriota bacterium]